MRKCNTSFILALLLAGSSLRAASLPAEAICEDAVAVIWIDADRLDPAQLEATAKALLGDNAKHLENPIKQLGALREAFTKVGGEALAIVVRGPDERDRSPEPHFVVTFKDGADPGVLGDFLKLTAGDGIAIAPAGKRALIIARRARLLPPAGKDGDTADAFSKGLREVGDAPAAVVFVPNANLRRSVATGSAQAAQSGEEFMPGITKLYKLLEHLVACERGVMTSTLGEKAKLSLTLTAKDADGAKTLVASVKPAAETAAKLDELVRDAAGPADPGVMMLSTLLGVIEPKQDGREVTIELEGKNLEHVASTMAKGIFAAQAKAQESVLASNMHQLGVAIHAYANDHKGKLPDSLDDLKTYVGGADALARLVTNPITGEKEGIKYVKPADTLNKLDFSAKMLFEVRDGKVNKEGYVGYADGSVRRTTPNQPVAPKPPPGDDAKKQPR